MNTVNQDLHELLTLLLSCDPNKIVPIAASLIFEQDELHREQNAAVPQASP